MTVKFSVRFVIEVAWLMFQLAVICLRRVSFEFVAHWHLVYVPGAVQLCSFVSATMATPPTVNVTEQALKKLEDQLTCGICLDSYTEPKLLQCFHVFCKQRLERLVVRDPKGLSLHCPSCRRSTFHPPTCVSGLQTAFYLNNLIEVRDAHRESQRASENPVWEVQEVCCNQFLS